MSKAYTLGAAGVFVLLVSIASNISEVTSIWGIEFSKTLAEVGAPSLGLAEVALVLIAFGFLLWGVDNLVS